MYDLIIVGAGPAGITASVYAARKRLRFLVISKDVGGQAGLTAEIENYTGYQFIEGQELVKRFREHLEQFKVDFHEREAVRSITSKEGVITVVSDKGSYEAKTVVIGSGRIPRKLNVEGEDTFKNRGVTYCATCDGPLFADMDVAVIGGGNSALDAVLQLDRIAKKIYLIDIADNLRADPVMVEKARKSDKVTIYGKTKVEKISGDKFVNGLTISQDGRKQELAVQGVFIEVGYMPASDFIQDVYKNKAGDIIVNCRCETNIPGIFAAGDVSSVPAKQIIVACGEGAKAALMAFDYITRKVKS